MLFHWAHFCETHTRTRKLGVHVPRVLPLSKKGAPPLWFLCLETHKTSSGILPVAQEAKKLEVGTSHTFLFKTHLCGLCSTV